MTLLEDFEILIDSPRDADPYGVFAALRTTSPVLRSEALQAWVVSRWADVSQCFDDPLIGPLGSSTGSSAIYGRTVLQMTGEEHRRKAAIVARRLRNPRHLSGDLREYVAALVDRHVSALPAAPAITDFKALVTGQIPLTVIADLMAMSAAASFADWYHRIVAASVSNVRNDPVIHERGVQAREELFEWITPIIEDKRRHPTDDLLSDLCNASFEGEQLSDDEIRSFCAFLLSAGIETTDRALSSLFTALATYPDQWQRLRADAGLVSSAVAEILRFRAPVQGAVRVALADRQLGGQQIAAGDKLILLLGSANHDDSVFERPEVFDVGRFEGREHPQFTPIGPLRAFGGGAHTCTGSLLARLEMEQILTAMLQRFESIEFADQIPVDVGFMLRSPDQVRLRLHESETALTQRHGQ